MYNEGTSDIPVNKSHSHSFLSFLDSASFDLTWTDTNICLFLSRMIVFRVKISSNFNKRFIGLFNVLGHIYEKQLQRIADVSNKVHSANFQKNALEEQVACQWIRNTKAGYIWIILERLG